MRQQAMLCVVALRCLGPEARGTLRGGLRHGKLGDPSSGLRGQGRDCTASASCGKGTPNSLPRRKLLGHQCRKPPGDTRPPSLREVCLKSPTKRQSRMHPLPTLDTCVQSPRGPLLPSLTARMNHFAPPVPNWTWPYCRISPMSLCRSSYPAWTPQGKRTRPLPPGAATAHLQAPPPPPWAGCCSHIAHILLPSALFP